ncbi:MAG TPA: heavy metal translocating P-type ATPase [Kiritimatiellia bacterium]|nr:heavy metal translocating P-type ATPase [Kiritimatiellia bacterium]HMP35803.1 heavy metal translocating P-type ATPase [Kiritimatiellia bacterium]
METNDQQERPGTPAEAIEQSGICEVEGILEADLCPVSHQLHVAFDPARISEREVARRLERMEPYLRQRFERCLFQVGSKACEACAVRLEKRAEAIPGVRRASASFIGGVMSVQFDEAQVREQEVLDRLLNEGVKVAPWRMPEAAGGAGRWWSSLLASPAEAWLTVATLVFLVVGAVTPGAGWPPVVATVAFAAAYVAGGWFGVQSAWASLREGTVDVDLLMILAAMGAAYVGAPLEGGTLLFLFALSNVLQQAAMERARTAIHALMKLRPTEALVRRDGKLVTLGIDALVVGDRVLVRPGERVPLDGEIVLGESALDEASLTGESMPVTKRVGDPVFAGTINTSGGLEVAVTRLARDSAIARLIQMVEHAQSEKAETQRFLDKAEQVYAAGVILFVIGLIVVPLVVGDASFREVFYRAMTVMVVASPCALVISTPASILSAIGGAARQGVLFKGGLHLERAAGISVVAFDKTGTLTSGKPAVTDVLAGVEAEVLALAAAVEVRSEHPLAKAIVAYAHARGVAVSECAGFQSLAGQGVRGRVGTDWVHVGDPRMFAREQVEGLAERMPEIERLQGQGKSCIVVTVQGAREVRARVAGIIALADVIRPDAAAVVAGLKRIGIKRVVMLTGDHRRVAEAIGREAGVDEVHAELMPEDKWRIVQSLKAAGPVAMVGDGVNDAPALASADIGIAMGAAGTDVAMETADIVLMGERLRPIVYALAISRAARRVVAQNLTFSLAVIVVLVIAALGYALPLPVGVIGHEGSTVLVCLNGLRLLRFKAPH